MLKSFLESNKGLKWFNDLNLPYNYDEKLNVFHGSPYHFDKFSNSNNSQGNGENAYGYGLYFGFSRQKSFSYSNIKKEISLLLNNIDIEKYDIDKKRIIDFLVYALYEHKFPVWRLYNDKDLDRKMPVDVKFIEDIKNDILKEKKILEDDINTILNYKKVLDSIEFGTEDYLNTLDLLCAELNIDTLHYSYNKEKVKNLFKHIDKKEEEINKNLQDLNYELNGFDYCLNFFKSKKFKFIEIYLKGEGFLYECEIPSFKEGHYLIFKQDEPLQLKKMINDRLRYEKLNFTFDDVVKNIKSSFYESLKKFFDNNSRKTSLFLLRCGIKGHFCNDEIVIFDVKDITIKMMLKQ